MQLVPSDVAFLLAPLALGMGLTALLTPHTFRQCGKRPALQPPGWVFGVAWTVLYALVGLAGFLAWRHAGRRWTPSLLVFVGSIGAMMMWWIVFSNWCAPAPSFAALASTLGGVAASALLLYGTGAVASAALLVPLVAWLCFACLLCFGTI